MNLTAIRFYALLVFSLLPLLLLISCSENDDESKIEATFSSLWDNQFSSCGNVSCHNSVADDGTENGPDLSSKTNFYNNLVNKSVDADYPNWVVKSGDCNTQKFIEPGNANASTVAGSLIQAVADDMLANLACTSSYNLHNVEKVTIGNQEIADALIEWINAGAKNN